ncbi:proline--tRNA ligase [candidate division LCP-89 bacterium B3_LCP]|uniref:Proline--tRNA ligase n=1 Tax=candidate division LCP-89 bacterium B3_LCP TaxID=2012998 RepID=A0A532V3X2_UNCL8|nr:MAG: proline--tRNA ligase [candidate division LCP-89 bacterium B3_LCP]
MRLSRAFIPTLKETPADAVIPSHQLMIRSGMIKQLAAGIYSELPFEWKAALKAIGIVREEMNRIGGQELFLPILNPVDVWEETGRATDFGDEMFRLKDRKNHQMCLAPTHEEIICDIARTYIRSYRDLPQIWYQFQSKMRDEPRPRSGVLRARQFIMKDAYSLDVDEEGLDASYQLHAGAYRRMFDRCGLDFFEVGASSGLMGGTGSQEFMVESPHGEDHTARCDKCGYAANLEVASSKPPQIDDSAQDESQGDLERVATPEKRTIEEVSGFLKIAPERLIKTIIIMAGDEKPVMVLLSGDDELQEAKLLSALGETSRPAHPDEIKEIFGCEAGFLGPYKAPKMRIIADNRLKGASGRVTGANEDHYHITGVDEGRHFQPDSFEDLRTAKDGEGCPNCQGTLHVTNAIELGHIFKLGTKYSSSMGANILHENGKERPIVMGSYGIGIGRILACAIESNHDEFGIIWPENISPYDVILIGINLENDEKVQQKADSLYEQLQSEGFDVLFDDRNVRPGFKFKDADLLGIPYQVIVSPKSLEQGGVEVKVRLSGERTVINSDNLLNFLRGNHE